MSIVHPPITPGAAKGGSSASPSSTESQKDSTLHHLGTAVIFTVVSIVMLGFVYPLVMTGIATLILPWQANGSIVEVNGKPAGSAIIGQLFTKPQYFQGRPSAAGKNGYDPTATGGTNLAPTSKKLIDATKATIAALKKANPDATDPVPMDLVTSSASGIDPDISPEAAYYQAPRVAKARHIDLQSLRGLIDQHIEGRSLGILGEPHVNVLALNMALDAAKVQVH